MLFQIQHKRIYYIRKVEYAFICMLFINIDLGLIYTVHVFMFKNARLSAMEWTKRKVMQAFFFF